MFEIKMLEECIRLEEYKYKQHRQDLEQSAVVSGNLIPVLVFVMILLGILYRYSDVPLILLDFTAIVLGYQLLLVIAMNYNDRQRLQQLGPGPDTQRALDRLRKCPNCNWVYLEEYEAYSEYKRGLTVPLATTVRAMNKMISDDSERFLGNFFDLPRVTSERDWYDAYSKLVKRELPGTTG